MKITSNLLPSFYIAGNLKRGDICVVRSVAGTNTALALENPAQYREWSGCFSLI